MQNDHTIDQETRDFFEGKELVDAVAKAASQEDLRRILHAGGVYGFSDEQLVESYRGLALSQNWEAIKELFESKDFESCGRKLAAYGVSTTKEEFDLINEVIAAASDESLIAENAGATSVREALEVFRRHGYHTISPGFLSLVQENIQHILDDGLLTVDELKALSGSSFYERCRKSINLVFALSTIAGLALGVSGVADPPMLIAIASGISLMFGSSSYGKA